MIEKTIKYGKNTITQYVKTKQATLMKVDDIVNSWKSGIDLAKGLRKPQLGALYAIKAHWTVSHEPATIVMPTGTGKTETMIATVVSEQIQRTLVIVPSDLLRKQTSRKFQSFGILSKIGVIDESVFRPVIATLNSTPASEDELYDIVNNSNVVISTATLLQRFPDAYINMLNELCTLLIVDEAHHIAAKTWNETKTRLSSLKCIQFTATPFRNDGKKLDGRIIYNFPLAMAQEQGYFQKINFCPLWEFDQERGDRAIAQAAVNQLKLDFSNNLNHAILVRAKDKCSADKLFNEIYLPVFSEFNPVLIHSGVSASEKRKRMELVTSGESKIVVCVDMFGEGIDIPNLKIAAIHDKYKSLPITLQFVGRFARSSSELGNATLVTNIANDELNESLQDLYSQDADWNSLLDIKSSNEIGKEISNREFVQNFDVTVINGVSIQQIRPKVSMTAYKTTQERWDLNLIKRLFEEDNYILSLNQEQNVLIIIERVDSKAPWTSYRALSDTNWNLHLVYWNKKLKLLYINSTEKNISDKLADTLFPRCSRIKGESVFRCLHGINRLMLGTVGLLTSSNGPIRFKMFAGFDVLEGISESLKHNSFKSNLFGSGYNRKGKISIGCSHKGRIWSRWVESIPYWVSWCDEIGSKLLDERIDTKNILSGVLVPEIIVERPESIPYSIDWPQDLDVILENRIEFNRWNSSYRYCDMSIYLLKPSDTGNILFAIGNEDIEEQFELIISDNNFSILTTKTVGLTISVGKSTKKLSEFFSEYPPMIKFVDQSTLEGNVLVKASSTPPSFSLNHITTLDWTGINIQKESQTNSRDSQSIQHHIIQKLMKSDCFEVIFDDDGPGEIADIITIKESDENIQIGFYHCKFSLAREPGARVKDLYEVCGQSEKSIKWCSDPRFMIDRLINREIKRQKSGGTRMDLGSLQKLKEIKNKLRIIPATFEITIVQPGVDSQKLTGDMLQLLSGTAAYLLDTFGINLKVICS